LADTFGARKVLTFVVFFWSVMTVATGHAWGFVSMLVIRFIFGLGEAGCYPTMTRSFEIWYPKSERGIASGVSHSGSMLGLAAVPPLGVLIISTWGWPAVFYIFGGVGVVWATFFWFMYRDHPEDHRRVNNAEAAYIHSGLPARSLDKAKVKVPWGQILSSWNMWAIALSYGAWAYGGYFFWFWMPTYMMEKHHISLKSMGYLAPLPLFAGAVGMVVGGVVMDVIYKKTKNIKLSRRIVGIGAMALASAFMLPVPFVSNPVLMVICMSICNFGNSAIVSLSWAVCIDVSGGFSGSVSSVMSTVGQASGSVSAVLFGIMAQRGSWTAPFFITSGIMFAACLLWAFVIDPSKAVTRPEPAVVAG
jgi:MFS family permease